MKNHAFTPIKNKNHSQRSLLGISALEKSKVAEAPDNDIRGWNSIKAFTLIELLVVVLIIGILSAIALPQYQKAVEKARAAEAFALMDGIYKAANSYYLANGTWPTQFDDLEIGVNWTAAQKSLETMP